MLSSGSSISFFFLITKFNWFANSSAASSADAAFSGSGSLVGITLTSPVSVLCLLTGCSAVSSSSSSPSFTRGDAIGEGLGVPSTKGVGGLLSIVVSPSAESVESSVFKEPFGTATSSVLVVVSASDTCPFDLVVSTSATEPLVITSSSSSSPSLTTWPLLSAVGGGRTEVERTAEDFREARRACAAALFLSAAGESEMDDVLVSEVFKCCMPARAMSLRKTAVG
mmetsp:Transcript_12084/g.19511  ORF Transcript_12084/g.19511 Transcript_12084/m.19511 type:complete len:225 (+) Transcript_12084:1918-2592(+)